MRKKTLFFTALFSLVSTVSAQGYRQGINRTMNPESLEHAFTFYQTLGWHLAAILMLPLLLYFVHGYFLSEWKRENFWLLGVVTFIISIGIIVLYPLVLLHI